MKQQHWHVSCWLCCDWTGMPKSDSSSLSAKPRNILSVFYVQKESALSKFPLKHIFDEWIKCTFVYALKYRDGPGRATISRFRIKIGFDPRVRNSGPKQIRIIYDWIIFSCTANVSILVIVKKWKDYLFCASRYMSLCTIVGKKKWIDNFDIINYVYQIVGVISRIKAQMDGSGWFYSRALH